MVTVVALIVCSAAAMVVAASRLTGTIASPDSTAACTICDAPPHLATANTTPRSTGVSMLWDTQDFPKRWNCGQWSGLHGWTHIVADLAIFLAYLGIPVVLWHFIRTRPDVPFVGVFWLFIAFIVACGFTHLLEAMMFWWPAYRVMGVAKLATAAISWLTIIALIPLIPRALRLRSPQQLELEVDQRTADLRRAKVELEQANATLDRRVRERTAELERSNVELNRFASAVSHDLKSPLRAVDNLANWIDEDMGDRLPDESRANLVFMRQRIARMDGFLDSMLVYARVGGDDATIEEVDVAEVIESAALSLEKPDAFVVECDGPMPVVKAPRVRLQQVFGNLIGNAIKHHDRDDGAVRILATEVGDRIAFVVRDDGPGIDPQFHGRVFNMFETLRPRDEVEGSGMGLAFVRKIVQSQGGEISVESKPGAGASFRFTWPKEWKGNDDE